MRYESQHHFSSEKENEAKRIIKQVFRLLTPRGDSPKKRRRCSSYLLGDKICELVPLRVLEPKMTLARVVAVPLRGL